MRTIVIAALACLLSVGAAHPTMAQNGRELFQRALVKERADADLAGAIAIYQRIVRDHARDHELAASALVRMGQCYERLGSSEAERAYQRVLRDFSDQAAYVAQARTRLAALNATATAARGPVARRVLSAEDTDMNDFNLMSPSLDGRRVAYVNMWDGGVYVRDLASGDVQRLAAALPPAVHYNPPRWSADGRRLAVATVDTATRVSSIELIDVATHAAVAVPGTRTQGVGSITPVDWSRDGRFLLCVRANHLVLIALDGGTETEVADSGRGVHGSLSPDGRFVAYAVGPDRDSRIFVRPVAGGPPRLMTAPQGNARNPVWSPDGGAIAYRQGDGIWVMPVTAGAPGGAPRQALVTGNITLRGWTEAGLYYTSWGRTETLPYQVQMDSATGGSAGDVPQGVPGRHPDGFQSFAWSPDMQRVAFASFNPPALSVYSSDRGTLETFDLGTEGMALRPWWSADGREVLVHRIRPNRALDSVSAVDAATGRLRTQVAAGRSASYSADGRTMAFTVGVSESSSRISEVVVAGVDGSERRVVATASGVGGPGISYNAWPWLSPRGDRVLYVRQVQVNLPDSTPGTLWVVGSDGSGARQLATAARITNAVWDPSGRFIAYTALESVADSARTVLRVVEIGTGLDRQIPLPATFPRRVIVVDWSRNGRLLGLVAFTEPRWEYWVAQGITSTP